MFSQTWVVILSTGGLWCYFLADPMFILGGSPFRGSLSTRGGSLLREVSLQRWGGGLPSPRGWWTIGLVWMMCLFYSNKFHWSLELVTKSCSIKFLSFYNVLLPIFSLIAINDIFGINGSSDYLIVSTKILVILKCLTRCVIVENRCEMHYQSESTEWKARGKPSNW